MKALQLVLLLLPCLALAAITEPEYVFMVKSTTKTVAHPYYLNGWSVGYTVDGVEGAELWLLRGFTYYFQANVTSSHPLYISTSADGATTSNQYSDTVMGNAAFDGKMLTFWSNATHPATNVLYYQCTRHLRMGFKINIVESTCAAGSFKNLTSNACEPCPAGTYTDMAGSFRCTPCQPGTRNGLAGQTKCSICPMGTASSGLNFPCKQCPAGFFSWEMSGVCMPCPPGMNSTVKSGRCSPCPHGYVSCGGKALCTQCKAGTYSYNGSACVPCTAGRYSEDGWDMCEECPRNTYSAIGAAMCTPCPPGTMGPSGANVLQHCQMF